MFAVETGELIDVIVFGNGHLLVSLSNLQNVSALISILVHYYIYRLVYILNHPLPET